MLYHFLEHQITRNSKDIYKFIKGDKIITYRLFYLFCFIIISLKYMEIVCKNCNNQSNTKYCPSCGQFMKAQRIDFHYLIHEIQHSIFHVDKGILYTIKELILRPSQMLKGYLSGKRAKHFKPFAFVTILATIYGFLSHYLHIYPNVDIISSSSQTQSAIQITFDWLYKHYALITYLLIPFNALFSFILFRKSNYNYFEHLVINSYMIGIQILFLIILLPLHYIFPTLNLFLPLLLSYLYMSWTFYRIFENNLFKSIIKIIGIIIFSSILGLLLGCAGGLYFLS
ncbi:DUF3667 domain-containing protein [Dysgonomonas sp. HDW5A]|uniref:DUF3667 domain-containing protein n=1 Tax=Dysgonomonas sp. HDW5A TaxID=2714926 RepID=UPI00351B91BD